MCFISKDSFTDPNLLALFDRRPQQNGTCELTKQNNVPVIDGSDVEVYMPIRALTRYYLNEWDYNTHFGGEKDFSKLFMQRGMLFNFDRIDEEAFYEYIETIPFSQGYYPYDEGVSLYAGYDKNGQQLMLLEAIGKAITYKVRKMNEQLHDRNLGSLLVTVKDIVDDSLPRTKTQINELTLYRGRIGHKARKYVEDWDFTPAVHFFPFTDDEIGPPPAQYANKGRMNREGFSFLYLGEDPETVIAEVRALPGDTVSIGKFRQQEPLVIADFSEITIDKFWMNDRELDLFEQLHSISKSISNPVGSNGGYVYVLTQLIAEELLRQGINGICFTSSLTGKKNYTIFKPNAFQYDAAEAFVCQIDSIKTRFTYLEVGNAQTHYTSR